MRYSIIIIFLLQAPTLFGQGFLKADGERIVDGNNQNVLLRGIGLGGWMLQEPYMLNLSGAAVAQYDIRKKITGLIGEKKTAEFYEGWLQNFCTKADIDSLAAWGFNSVRLPMHYNLYTLPVEREPVAGKNTWLEKGFALTDSLLSWCAANQVYLILDLHAAPGGQGHDCAISDRDTTKPSLWQSEANQNKTIALWQKLAARYAGKQWIGGYDLVNEPNWGFTAKDDRNGCAEPDNSRIRDLYVKITEAIRSVDKDHLIFIEGNCWANNYNGMFPLWDDNLVISFHKYWNFNTQGSIEHFLKFRQQYKVPLWLGETGENSNDWFTTCIRLMEENNIGWNMWPLKKSGINNPLQIKINPKAKEVFAYFKNEAAKPSAKQAWKGLQQLARDANIRNNIYHSTVTDAMFRQVQNDQAKPFREHLLTDSLTVFAANYDIGRAGEVYHDADSAEYWVSTSVRRPWNTGGMYRNDGVDIETCTDQVTNGFNVGWIEPGEWLQYSVYAARPGMYQLNLRYAAKEKPGEISLLMQNASVAKKELPATGGFQNWGTQNLATIPLQQGWNRLRLLAVQGGFNLNYLQLQRSADLKKDQLTRRD